jgi:hypothetical protein
LFHGRGPQAGYTGARATFSFKGTSIAWKTDTGPDLGITNVYLDGVKVKSFDGYAPGYGPVKSGYAESGLANKNTP